MIRKTALIAASLMIMASNASYCASLSGNTDLQTKSHEAIKKAAGKKEEENKKVKTEIRNRTIEAVSHVSGTGKVNASFYDMPLYNSGMLRKIKVSNGSGLSLNSKYPFASGASFTSDTLISAKYSFSDCISAGISAGIFTCMDSDDHNSEGKPIQRPSRVMGTNTPYSNRTMLYQDDRSSWLPGAMPYLDRAYLEFKGKHSSCKAEAGNIKPSSGKKYCKFINTNWFLFKSPHSQYSRFGRMSDLDAFYTASPKDTRTYDYGARISGKSNDFYYELFSLSYDKGPHEPETYGRYCGASLGIASEKLRIGTIIAKGCANFLGDEAKNGRNSAVMNSLSFHGEYDITDSFSAFFMTSHTDYREDGRDTGNTYGGGAFCAGLALSSPDMMRSAKISWQRVSPDYDPLGYHKASVFHNNYQGINIELSGCWGNADDRKKNRNCASLKYYNLSQIDPSASSASGSGRYIYGDYFFKETGDGAKGKIKMLTPSVNIYLRNLNLSAGAEYEKMRLYRPEDSDGLRYRKNIDNYSVWASWSIDDRWTLTGGYRETNFGGEWISGGAAIPSLQKLSMPKIEVAYKNGEYFSSCIHAEFPDFHDMTKNTEGYLNDWHGSTVYMDTSFKF